MGCGASASNARYAVTPPEDFTAEKPAKHVATIPGNEISGDKEITSATRVKSKFADVGDVNCSQEVVGLTARTNALRDGDMQQSNSLPATGAAIAKDSGKDYAQLPGVCIMCGNTYMADERFCRQCGLQRSTQALAQNPDSSSRMKICEALRLREKYLFAPAAAQVKSEAAKELIMVMVDGVADVPGLQLRSLPSRHVFKEDLTRLWAITKDPEVKSAAMARLMKLSNRFQSYDMEQASVERDEAMALANDLHSVMKVDNHIHLAAAMPPRMLLRFIKDKMRCEPNREVIEGKSLRELIKEAVYTTPENAADKRMSRLDSEAEIEKLDSLLHLDSLRTCADDHFYHRFDQFNDAYNPLGSKSLRTVFLKPSNHIDGAYFGELASAVLDANEKNNVHSEMRLSIYGKKLNEWDALAGWMKRHGLHADQAVTKNLWLVQIPRLFGTFRKLGVLGNFEDMLNNIFQPLFEVALDPSSHPDLADVLPSISGLDSVDDESINDPITARRSQLYGEDSQFADGTDVLRPMVWNIAENPPYSYYSYYLWVNLQRWNDLCHKLGRPWHFTFRPHAGEAGPVHHLATTFLLADGINHGVNLQHTPTLQYLYLITQLGVSMSPLSNNALFTKVRDNPFPDFFHRGLNVTLSTDDPLMFHSTNEPLLEEYLISKHVYSLSSTDLCELAANSVRQSSFAPPGQPPGRILGLSSGWDMDPSYSNVPRRRLIYRHRCLCEELLYLEHGPPPVPEVAPLPCDADWRTKAFPKAAVVAEHVHE